MISLLCRWIFYFNFTILYQRVSQNGKNDQPEAFCHQKIPQNVIATKKMRHLLSKNLSPEKGKTSKHKKTGIIKSKRTLLVFTAQSQVPTKKI
jgi:hypothetical protein